MRSLLSFEGLSGKAENPQKLGLYKNSLGCPEILFGFYQEEKIFRVLMRAGENIQKS